MKKRLLSVLLPIYNERENVRPLLDELAVVLTDAGQPFEVIAVDDASTDGTSELLAELANEYPYLKVIFFRANTGQTAALDAGFRHASGELIATLDADMQNDPRDIPAMLAVLDQGYDCVAGWRKKRKDGFFLRRVPSLAANALIRFLWRSRQRDLGCAIKVYRHEITDELRLYGEMHRFLGLILEGMGAKVATFAVNHPPRHAGYSKYNLTRVFKVLLDLVTIWFLQSFRTKPLHVFGGLGVMCFGASFLSALTALWQKVADDFSFNRNPLFTLSIFLTVLGVQFVVMGLLAELIIRNYFESTNRSPYSIRKKVGFEESGTGRKRVA